MLFFTGHANAGENLEVVLRERDKNLVKPILMSDASSMNMPDRKDLDCASCMTHIRRYFVNCYKDNKTSCTYVIQLFKRVYAIDAKAKKLLISDEERLLLHQTESGPIMTELKLWLANQLDKKIVEENSALGEAILHTQKHWERLTLFLRLAGAPLTNDELEQKFKMVKLFLKNALFYRNLNGAFVGDIFMSIIHTAVLAGENPYEYLVAIQENRHEVLNNTDAWMPWNFRQNLTHSVNSKQVS